jgi:hypothetical protein
MNLLDLIQQGKDLRDTGMVRAQVAQEFTAPGWSDRAYGEIERIASIQEFIHANDLRGFEKPSHPNAWGGVWMRAIKNRIIARTGRIEPCIDPLKHKHNSPVYRSLVYRGLA